MNSNSFAASFLAQLPVLRHWSWVDPETRNRVFDAIRAECDDTVLVGLVQQIMFPASVAARNAALRNIVARAPSPAPVPAPEPTEHATVVDTPETRVRNVVPRTVDVRTPSLASAEDEPDLVETPELRVRKIPAAASSAVRRAAEEETLHGAINVTLEAVTYAFNVYLTHSEIRSGFSLRGYLIPPNTAGRPVHLFAPVTTPPATGTDAPKSNHGMASQKWGIVNNAQHVIRTDICALSLAVVTRIRRFVKAEDQPAFLCNIADGSVIVRKGAQTLYHLENKKIPAADQWAPLEFQEGQLEEFLSKAVPCLFIAEDAPDATYERLAPVASGTYGPPGLLDTVDANAVAAIAAKSQPGHCSDASMFLASVGNVCIEIGDAYSEWLKSSSMSRSRSNVDLHVACSADECVVTLKEKPAPADATRMVLSIPEGLLDSHMALNNPKSKPQDDQESKKDAPKPLKIWLRHVAVPGSKHAALISTAANPTTCIVGEAVMKSANRYGQGSGVNARPRATDVLDLDF